VKIASREYAFLVPRHNLKPQDVLVACRLALASPGSEDITQRGLAADLCVSLSTVHSALKNLRGAGLVKGSGPYVVEGGRLLDFLVHGVPVVYQAERTEVVRGVATGIFSPYFRERFAAGRLVATVWPYGKGKEVGEGLVPLYPTVPVVCSRNPELYQLLAAVDVLRVGKSREREAAVTYLRDVLKVTAGISVPEDEVAA